MFRINEFGSNTLDRRAGRSRSWLVIPGVLMMLFIAQVIILGDVLPALAQAGDLPVVPLPHDCNGFTPPGEPQPVCCVSGYVHYTLATLVEPYVASGAVVTLTTQAGVVISTTTTPGWLNPDGLAYFKFDLDSAGVQPGEVITLAASYLDKQNHVVYLVSPGGQQVDVVLPEAQGFDAITVIVDDQDTAASPQEPGFHIAGSASQLVASACSLDARVWGATLYTGTTTSGGVGPATVSATYRPTLPVSGTWELYAYAPRGCTSGLPQYIVHLGGGEIVTTSVDQVAAGQQQREWISLGEFVFLAGTDGYVTVNNVTGQPNPKPIAYDALKWEFRTPFPAIATITVDDLDVAATPDQAGFYEGPGTWSGTSACDWSLNCPPVYWNGHIYWKYTIVADPPGKWAQWRTELSQGGVYDVYVFAPHCYANARTARYRIYADDSLLDEVVVNLALQGGVWMRLGSYTLPAGASGAVYLDNVTGVSGQIVTFDAVRWVLRPRLGPVAMIHTITPMAPIQGQDIVTLHGSGVDTDDEGKNIVASEWRSNLDGVIATTGTFSMAANALSAGTHVLTFRVRDNEDVWSRPITTHLYIQPAVPEETWHFMLYLAGDNDLSLYLDNALIRLEGVLPIEGVTVTVLFDRPGGSGVWRYLVQPDGVYVNDVNRWYLAEKNTGDPATLADYVLWAQESYPADHTYLAIANHGRGTQGIAWDITSGDDYLSLPELRQALQQGTDSGRLKVDVLHLDACLMGMLEVGYELWPYADYLLASENLAWATFGYDRYVRALTPVTTPRSLATSVAEIYHAQLASHPHTIAVLDLGQITMLAGKVNMLAEALASALPGETLTLTMVLNQVQRFDSRGYGRIDQQDEYIDVRNLAELLAVTAGDEAVRAAAQAVLTATTLSQIGAMTTTVVHERHASGSYGGIWWNLDHAEGVAIYFPPSSNSWGYSDYISPSLRLGHDTYWDELLVAYLGVPPTPGPTDPSPPQPLDLLPQGQVIINDGAYATNQLAVTLTLTAEHASGVMAMRFSPDRVLFTEWLSYTELYTWTFTRGDGSKMLYVQFKGMSGSVSDFVSDTIFLDSLPPMSSVDPLPATTPQLGITLTWSGQDAGSGVDFYDIQVREGISGTWTDWLTHTTSLSGTFVGRNGHTYAFRSRATDRAGNTQTWPSTPDAETTIDEPSSVVVRLFTQRGRVNDKLGGIYVLFLIIILFKTVSQQKGEQK